MFQVRWVCYGISSTTNMPESRLMTNAKTDYRTESTERRKKIQNASERTRSSIEMWTLKQHVWRNPARHHVANSVFFSLIIHLHRLLIESVSQMVLMCNANNAQRNNHRETQKSSLATTLSCPTLCHAKRRPPSRVTVRQVSHFVMSINNTHRYSLWLELIIIKRRKYSPS